MDLTESFVFAIGIIVALVPEGMLPTVTLSLAIGVQRMVRRNALVRRLSAVETLSAVNVICTAVRPGSADLRDMKAQDLEQDLTFIGLVAMFDPPRPEVPEAIAQCHQAGIRVTMVTGDYGLTAEAIAQQIGLVEATPTSHEPIRVITGETLGHLFNAQLQQMVKYRSRLVFARMSPEHKLRLVEAYKATGAVVAVTGDGVNDAPALRAAHIGIAMGLNGTDVAREAADMVLTDDNFATIVSVIEEGRTIYQPTFRRLALVLA